MNKTKLFVKIGVLFIVLFGCTHEPIKLKTCSFCKYISKESADSITKRLINGIYGVDYLLNKVQDDSSQSIKPEAYQAVEILNDDLLSDFFQEWYESVNSHSHQEKEATDVLKNICDIYTTFFVDPFNDRKYFVIQNGINYDIKDSYSIELVDFVDFNFRPNKQMQLINDFRPCLKTEYAHKILYFTKEYEITLDSVLNKMKVFDNISNAYKIRALGNYIRIDSNELPESRYVFKSFYVSYIGFNNKLNKAIFEFRAPGSEFKTWLISKQNGKWIFEKELRSWVM